jgi:hypothetical protein
MQSTKIISYFIKTFSFFNCGRQRWCRERLFFPLQQVKEIDWGWATIETIQLLLSPKLNDLYISQNISLML